MNMQFVDINKSRQQRHDADEMRRMGERLERRDRRNAKRSRLTLEAQSAAPNSPKSKVLTPFEGSPFVTLIPLNKWDATKRDKKGRTIQIGKAPRDKDWPTRDGYTYEGAVEEMDKGFNVGVRMDGVHNGMRVLVIDIDPRNFPLDPDDPLEEDRLDMGAQFLEAVGMSEDDYPVVITGSGGKHIYVLIPAGFDHLESLEGYPGVEFKSGNGRQVVAPGSLHPKTGEHYNWKPNTGGRFFGLKEGRGNAPVTFLHLTERPAPTGNAKPYQGDPCKQSDIDTMLSGLDPEDFRDEKKWFGLMCACYHASAGKARYEFIAWSTSDPVYSDEGYAIGRRWDSLARDDGRVKRTIRTIIKHLKDVDREDCIPDRLKTHAETRSAADDFDAWDVDEDEDIIVWSERDGVLTELSDRVIETLSYPTPTVFAFGGMIVKPAKSGSDGLASYDLGDEEEGDNSEIRRDIGATVLKEVKPGYLTELAGGTAKWRKVAKLTKAERDALPEDKQDQTTKLVPCLPHQAVINTIYSRNSLQGFQPIRGAFNCPVVLPTGEVIQKEGYNRQHGVFISFDGASYPVIPDKVTKEDALKALDTIRALYRHYRFASPASEAVALSGVLTALIRPFLPSAPLHAVSAEHAGAGKTKLAQTWSIIATGAGAALMGQPGKEEEFGKKIETSLLAGDRVILVDNCSHTFQSPTFEAVMTTGNGLYTIRILGAHEQMQIPVNQFMAATGNFFQLGGDSTRRGVVCKIECNVNPFNETFPFDPVAKAKADRAQLVVAGLTVLKAYADAERPIDNRPALGSFEQWSRIAVNPICWLLGDEYDPAITVLEQKASDPAETPWLDVLRAWDCLFGEEPALLSEVHAIALDVTDERQQAAIDLEDAITTFADQRTWDAAKVGNWIKGKVGVQVDSLKLVKLKKTMHGVQYQLMRIE